MAKRAGGKKSPSNKARRRPRRRRKTGRDRVDASLKILMYTSMFPPNRDY